MVPSKVTTTTVEMEGLWVAVQKVLSYNYYSVASIFKVSSLLIKLIGLGRERKGLSTWPGVCGEFSFQLKEFLIVKKQRGDHRYNVTIKHYTPGTPMCWTTH